jgi:NADH-quinone oxidoreductase subunit J
MMTPHAIIGLGTALAAIGIWLMLPGMNTRRYLGGLLAAIGFGLLGSRLPWIGDWLAGGLLAAISIVTVIAAVATISCRSPVYCAIWFGMTLSGTAGLFLLAGAQFLAVATIVVYAGAILVTFLFVLMLSQPEGHTTYDRRSWEALVSAFTGAVLVGILTATIGASVAKTSPELSSQTADKDKVAVMTATNEPSWEAEHAAARARPPLGISQLGSELFTRYLVAVEAAGALLFAALVGAAIIVAQGREAMRGRNPLPGALAGGTPAPRGGTAHAN